VNVGEFTVNSIVTGNALELIEKLPDNSIDILLTDPPYFLPAQAYIGTREKGYKRTLADTSILSHYFQSFFEQVDRVLKPTSTSYIFCDAKSYPIFYIAMFPIYKHIRLLIWDKMTSYNGHTWRHQHELIAWGEREDTPRIPTGDGDVLRCRGVQQKDRVHGAEKPVDLLTKLLQKHGESNVVLDTFCGSGTSAEAAKRTGNYFIGFELDQSSANQARERILSAERVFQPQQGSLFSNQN
jgi:site-specific DNA-methyltransferase (adenine-specific)